MRRCAKCKRFHNMIQIIILTKSYILMRKSTSNKALRVYVDKMRLCNCNETFTCVKTHLHVNHFAHPNKHIAISPLSDLTKNHKGRISKKRFVPNCSASEDNRGVRVARRPGWYALLSWGSVFWFEWSWKLNGTRDSEPKIIGYAAKS